MLSQGQTETQRWDSLEINKIASALFLASDGKKRKLLSRNYQLQDTVWGDACNILFPGEIQRERDRFHLMNAWTFNRKNLNEIYESFYSVNKEKPQLTQKKTKSQSARTDDSDDIKGHCFCQKIYKEVYNLPMIQCDECKQWYHGMCALVDPNEFGEDDYFKCAVCEGHLSIPNIFEQTKSKGSDSDYDDISSDEDFTVKRKDQKDGMSSVGGSSVGNEHDLHLRSPSLSDDPLDGGSDCNSDGFSKLSEVSASEQAWCRSPIKSSPNKGVTSQKTGSPVTSYKTTSMRKNTLSTSKLSLTRRRAKGSVVNRSSEARGEERHGSGIQDTSDVSQEEQWEDDDEDNRKMERETREIAPTSFSFTLPFSDWKHFFKKDTSVMTFEDETVTRSIWTSGKEYCNSFDDKFRKVQKGCVLAFREKRLNQSKTWGKFFTAYAVCNQETCTAKWAFTIEDTPQDGNPIIVKTRLLSGNIHHSGETIKYRRMHGLKKESTMVALKERSSAAERMKRFQKADKEALNLGNYTEVGTLTSLHRLKAKMATEGDLHPDVVKDILLTQDGYVKCCKDQKERVKGYIRFFSVLPVMLIAYTKQQMELFRDIVAKEQNVTLQFDGTGCIFNKFPHPYDQKETILYTLVKRSPVKGAALPLLEFVLNDSSMPNLHFCLHHFFYNLRQVMNVKKKFYGIQKIEVDFSQAMIAAVNLLFNNCPLVQTMRNFWNIMIGEPGVQPFAIHICRFHLMSALRRQILSCFRDAGKEAQKTIKQWCQRFVRATDLWNLHKYVTDISNICAYKYTNEIVNRALQALQERTYRTGPNHWENFQSSHNDSSVEPFWKMSPFGEYSGQIIENALSSNERHVRKASTSDHENIYYNHDFLHYLKISIFPFFPIITHSVFNALQIPVTEDTTNIIEGYHNYLKNNIHGNKTRHRLSRFLRKQYDYLDGACAKYEIEGLRGSRKKKDEKLFTSTPKSHRQSAGSQNENRSRKDLRETKKTVKIKKEPGLESEPTKYTQSSTASQKQESRSNDKHSPEAHTDKFKKGKSRTSTPITTTFRMDVPVVPYGAKFDVNKSNIKLTNTCNFDTILQILLFLYRKNNSFLDLIEEEACHSDKDKFILECMENLNSENYDEAKKIWLVNILKLKDIGSDMENSDCTTGLPGVQHLFPVSRLYVCKNKKCPIFGQSRQTRSREESTQLKNTEFYTVDIIAGNVENMLLKLNSYNTEYAKCHYCQQLIHIGYETLFSHSFFMYPLSGNVARTTEENLPLKQVINGNNYTVFAYTTYHTYDDDESTPHYKVTVVFEEKRYLYDDLLSSPITVRKLGKNWVTSVWLLKSD